MLARVIALLLTLSASSSMTMAADSCPTLKPQNGEYSDLCDNVFRLTCGDTVLTGFSARVGGDFGIVTALHGVLGCKEVTATNLHLSLSDLRLVKVDVERDGAFLSVSPPIGSSLRVDRFLGDQELRIVGYPQALNYQQSHRLEPNQRPLAQLKELLPPAELLNFTQRASPTPDVQVLSLSGPLQRGESGAPILTKEGTVVAIANGGLLEGTVGLNWAIPLTTVRWSNVKDVSDSIARIGGGGPGPLFGVAPQPAVLAPLFVVDGFARPGRIYRIESGNISEFYVRPNRTTPYSGNRTLSSIAVNQKGVIFFADANNEYVFRLDDDRVEKPVYKHKTYVRHLGFDPLGRLYFSEASGTSGDGTIFRLDGGRAVPFYTVHLPEVDGYWAGIFAFDKRGDLWLSSGNRVPAHLYKIFEGHPRIMFSFAGSIMGMRFASDGDLLFADYRQTIQRLQLPGFLSSVAYSNNLFRWASDVDLVHGEP